MAPQGRPPLMRSIMSVPGSSERFLGKAEAIPADVIAFDLEDSVAPAEKERARGLVAETLVSFPKDGRRAFVRPNALDTGLLEEDLAAVVGPALDAVHLPKVDAPATLHTVDAYLTFLERTRGLEPGAVRLVAWIESAEAVSRIEAICGAGVARLMGVSFGAEDYVATLGTSRSADGHEIAYARGRIVNAARAQGLAAIDCAEADVTDLSLFERQAVLGRQLGYEGKFCIHPSQVAVANRAFAPGEAEVADARRVVAAFEEGIEAGRGAVSLDGSMVDVPVYLRAKELLMRHEQMAGARAG